MPKKKATKKAAAKKATTKKATTPKAAPTNHKQKFLPGKYIVPRGDVSIAVPTFWTLRQTNEDLELEAPSGNTSVLINAYHRNKDAATLDSREYLQHFLTTASSATKPEIRLTTKTKSVARFRDVEGDNWEALFLSNGDTLLLATCNIHGPRTGKEAKVAAEVMQSLALKRK